MWRWISVALIVILVGGGVFSGMTITNTRKQLDELESDYATLQSDYYSLEYSYSLLESNYESLHSDYYILQGEMSQLESSYSQLQAENESLRQLLKQYEEVPHAYYYTGPFSHHSNTYEELCWFLTYEFYIPGDYEVDVFDCSESAAYLEWALETAGFDAYIATGRTPWSPNSGHHAWVITYTKDYIVAIEATALTGEYYLWYAFTGRVPGIVYSNDLIVPGWHNYYEGYDNLYNNIYQVIRNHGSTEEWNWWEGFWGFR